MYNSHSFWKSTVKRRNKTLFIILIFNIFSHLNRNKHKHNTLHIFLLFPTQKRKTKTIHNTIRQIFFFPTSSMFNCAENY